MTPAEIARGVAADIRRQGHFQSKPGQHLASYFGQGQVCVIMNPTTVRCGDEAYARFREAVEAEAGLTPGSGLLAEWSDQTPAEEVLAVLDRIAAEPRFAGSGERVPS